MGKEAGVYCNSFLISIALIKRDVIYRDLQRSLCLAFEGEEFKLDYDDKWRCPLSSIYISTVVIHLSSCLCWCKIESQTAALYQYIIPSTLEKR